MEFQVIFLLLVWHLEDFLHPLNCCLLIDLEWVLHGLYEFIEIYLTVLILVQVVKLHQVLWLLLDTENVECSISVEESFEIIFYLNRQTSTLYCSNFFMTSVLLLLFTYIALLQSKEKMLWFNASSTDSLFSGLISSILPRKSMITDLCSSGMFNFLITSLIITSFLYKKSGNFLYPLIISRKIMPHPQISWRSAYASLSFSGGLKIDSCLSLVSNLLAPILNALPKPTNLTRYFLFFPNLTNMIC